MVFVTATRSRKKARGRTRLELAQTRGDVAHGLEEVDGRRPPQRLCRAESCRCRAGMLEAERESVGLCVSA